MKRVIIIALLVTGMSTIMAQNFSSLESIELTNNEQVNKAQEQALDCCYYLTSVRYDKKDAQRTYAAQFVDRWINARKGEGKVLNAQVQEMTEGREDLNELYVTCYAMRHIENEGALSEFELRQEALEALLTYCDNPVNKIKLSKELKTVLTVWQEGQLEAYLSK